MNKISKFDPFQSLEIQKRTSLELKRLFLMSLLIDFLGNISYLVPILGEIIDIAWAPISANLLWNYYPELPSSVAVFNFAEELLPGTDIIPTALICWLYVYYRHVKDFGYPTDAVMK
jgi:hypothetical protein